MKLIDIQNGSILEAIIDPVGEEDFTSILKEDQFLFDWSKLKHIQLYKIRSISDTKILGLIAFYDVNHEKRLHIELIENALENTGSTKKIDRVAGCLIAFVCKKSFEKGYYGFVSLVPKTLLINHYVNKYGFKQFGRMLAIDFEDSKFLIEKYLNDEGL